MTTDKHMGQPTDMQKKDANLDPISKAPGAHPVGTGIGAAAGGAAGIAAGVAASAATGMATGTVLGGPAGAAIGLVVGAVAGGLAGKAVGEAVDPTVEDSYWKGQHAQQPYHNADSSYEDYQPAYRAGYLGASRYEGKSFDSVEGDLEGDYESDKGRSKLSWQEAKVATRAAWDRATGSEEPRNRAM